MAGERPLAASKAVAEYLAITPNKLAKLRAEGTGPAFVRLGPRNIKYRWSEVEAWIDAQTHTATDQY